MDSSLFFYARTATTDDTLSEFRSQLHEFQEVDSVRDGENNTLLHAAVSCSNANTVRLLLEERADALALNNKYDTPLCLAKAASKKVDCTREESEVFRIIKDSLDRRGDSAKKGGEKDINSQGESSGVIYSEIRCLSTSECPEHRVTEEECESKERITNEAEERIKREECQEKSRTMNKMTDTRDYWTNGKYEDLLTRLEEDNHFPANFTPIKIDDSKPGAEELRKFVERRKRLHGYIESGNLPEVKKATRYCNSFLCLNVKNESALYIAAKNKQLEIFTYLKLINFRYKDDKPKRPHEESEKYPEKNFSKEESEAVNRFMDDYFEERGNFHILNLVTSTRVLGKFTEKLEKITDDLYGYLDKLDHVSPLMKVLKYENVRITFDFEKENIHRVYQGYRGRCRGISDIVKRKMFIGAKGCEPQVVGGSFQIVAGTVAHEICHLAIDVLYQNHAKPYKKDKPDKERDFGKIAEEIKKISSSEMDDVIARVFKYEETERHAELIVRVPHMLALYGESRGKRIFLQNPVLKKLYAYYEENVVPHCKMYSEGKNFKHDLVRIRDLKDLGAFVEKMEIAEYTTMVPFSELQNKFISYENIFILVTSSVYLSSSVIYHQLKSQYDFNFDTRCLFIELNAFIKDFKIILNAYKMSACDYLILSSNDVNVDFIKISVYFKKLSFINKKKKCILVVRSDCKLLKPGWKTEIQYHRWNELTDYSMKNLLEEKKIVFQGNKMKFRDFLANLTETSELTSEELVPSLIQPEELSYLIDEENISISNTDHQKFPGNSGEYYMNRKFARESLRDAMYIMVKGPSMLPTNKMTEEINKIVKEIRIAMAKLKIPVEKMTRLNNCTLMEEKFTILKLRHKDAGFLFKRISENMSDSAGIFCINFKDREPYTRMSEENTRKIKDFCKSENIGEGELITFSDSVQDRVVVISDEPGAGKSTVIAKIIQKLKKEDQSLWIERIDLNDFADDVDNPVGLKYLKCIEESQVIDFFMKMVGLRNCMERTFFKFFHDLPSKMKLFFDGFDEISPTYKDCVTILLRVLIEKTKVQIWITTRKHEREYLEDFVNTFSYKLEPLSLENQSKLIGKIWKHKMKCRDDKKIEKGELDDTAVIFRIRKKIEDIVKQFDYDLSKEETKYFPIKNQIQKEEYLQKKKDSQLAKEHLVGELKKLISFIDKQIFVHRQKDHRQKDKKRRYSRFVESLKKKVDELNLDPYAHVLLRNMPDTIFDKNNLFTGVPLLLYMVAVLAYDKNLEFNAYSDTYTLYTDVIKGKIEIYLREKMKSEQNSQSMLTMKNLLEIVIYKLHEKFAFKVIKAKDLVPAALQETYKQVVLEFGVIVPIRNNLSFVHRTFADFFYCKWMLSKFETGKMIEKELEEVLQEPQYATVRHFLNDKYKNSKVEGSFGIPGKLMKEINVKNIFRFCVSIKSIEDCVNVWQDILIKYEQVSDKKSFMYFLSSIGRTEIQSVHVLSVLSGSLSDHSLLSFVDSNIFNIRKCSVECVDMFLRMLKRMICFKAYERCKELDLRTSLLGKTEEEVDNMFKEIKDPHGISETISLLERRDSGGNTFLLLASEEEYAVFEKVLKFFEEILDKDQLEDYLVARNNNSLTILHYSSIMGSHTAECDSTLKTLVEVKEMMKPEAYLKLIEEEDSLGCNFLHYFVWKSVSPFVKDVLTHLELWNSNVLVKLVEKKNKEGLNVLHPACNNSDREVLKEILLWAERVMSKQQFLNFVKSQDKTGNTIFHTRAKFVRTHPEFGSLVYEYKTVRELDVLMGILDDKSRLELMTLVNAKNETFLHTSASGHLGLKNLIYATEVLDTNSLENLLSKVDSEGNTFLHKLASQEGGDIVHALRKLKFVLPELSLKRLLKIENLGQGVLGTVRYYKPNFLDVILSFLPS